MNSFYVYVYRDSAGNPFYVGKGKGKRSRCHLHACRNSKRRSYRTMFYTKLRKMARLKEEPVIDVLKDNLAEADAFHWERYYIAFWGRRDIGSGCLCNHSDGGEGQTGHQHSEETRQKMREAWQRPGHREHQVEINLGREVSVETRAKIGKSQTGRVHSPESIEKTAAAHRGMKRSAETCRRISEANSNPSKETREKMSKASKIPIVALDINTGEDLMKFDSAIGAASFFGISNVAITNTLRGKTLSSAGCRWRYDAKTYQRFDESLVDRCKANKISVVALDIITGEDLMEFDSVTDAACFFDCSICAISNVLKERALTSATCRWRYANESYQRMNESVGTRQGRVRIPVVALDIKTGEDLMEFDSSKDAAYFFDCSISAINNTLKGKSKTSSGCRWRYA